MSPSDQYLLNTYWAQRTGFNDLNDNNKVQLLSSGGENNLELYSELYAREGAVTFK